MLDELRWRWSQPHDRRRLLVAGAVAVLVVVAIVFASVRLSSGGGSSSAGIGLSSGSSSGTGASLWPAGVATGFLADCARAHSNDQSFCGCALSHVEAHVASTAYVAMIPQITTSGTVPLSVTHLEAGCRPPK